MKSAKHHWDEFLSKMWFHENQTKAAWVKIQDCTQDISHVLMNKKCKERKMKIILKRTIALLLALELFLIPGVSLVCAQQKEKQTVKVAVTDFPHYLAEDNEGNHSGYAYDYLMDIAEYTGWKYEFEEMTLKQAHEAVQNGGVDIVVGERRGRKWVKKVSFSEIPMGQDSTVLCVNPENNKYAFNDFEAFDGKKIAVLRESGRIDVLKEELEDADVQAELVSFDNDEAVKKALEDGEVDAALMSSIRCEENHKIAARMDYDSLYFMMNRSRPELKKALDAAQKEIHIANPYYEDELNQKHYSNVGKKVAFTAEEKDFVDHAKNLKVAVDPDWCPMSYYDEKKNGYSGIIIDFFERIGAYTGISFEYVPDEGPKKNKRDLQTGKIDLLACVIYQKELGHAYEIKKTEPYYSDSLTAVMNQDVNDYQDAGCRVAAKTGYPLFQWDEERNKYKNLTYYSNYQACIDEVNDGKQDVAFIPNYCAGYLTGHSYYQKIKAYAVPDSDYDYCIGVPTTQDQRLIGVLNKSIANLSQETRNDIVQRNLQSLNKQYNVRDFFHDNASIIMFVLVIIMCVIALVVLRIWKLQKEKNAELKEAIHKADEANAAKSDFLSRMSHDIRTPMNAIVGMTNFAIEEIGNPEKVREYLGKIDSSSKVLLGLVNDVLDMAKIESKELVLTPSRYDYNEFIETLTTMFTLTCQEKKVEFEVNPGNIDVTLLVDKARFNKIFINVLSNAIKYTPEGGKVTFDVQNIEQHRGRLSCDFIITDTGIGMSKEFMEHMYDPFTQENTQETANIQGTGLGMSIVKNLVELMGGQIEVNSRLGKGTSVKLHMDIETVEKKPEMQRNTELQYEVSLEGKQVLLVEDHPLNTEIAKRILEKKGIVVTCAENGQVAVDLFAKSEEHFFKLILMDIRMPVMDGLEATRKIRAMQRADATTVPIIALSANAFDEDGEQSRKVGMNAHLAKPFDKDQLYTTLRQWISE